MLQKKVVVRKIYKPHASMWLTVYVISDFRTVYDSYYKKLINFKKYNIYIYFLCNSFGKKLMVLFPNF